MKTTFAILALLFMTSFSASAQEPIRKDPLLDRLTGSWIFQGTIAGHETTHDIESEWVLSHEYLRLHETSREKNVQANPRMKRSSLLNGTNRRTNTDACGSTRPRAVVSPPPSPKANGAMTKSSSSSRTKIRIRIRTAASAQPSYTVKAVTLGAGSSITNTAASLRRLREQSSPENRYRIARTLLTARSAVAAIRSLFAKTSSADRLGVNSRSKPQLRR